MDQLKLFFSIKSPLRTACKSFEPFNKPQPCDQFYVHNYALITVVCVLILWESLFGSIEPLTNISVSTLHLSVSALFNCLCSMASSQFLPDNTQLPASSRRLHLLMKHSNIAACS